MQILCYVDEIVGNFSLSLKGYEWRYWLKFSVAILFVLSMADWLKYSVTVSRVKLTFNFS